MPGLYKFNLVRGLRRVFSARWDEIETPWDYFLKKLSYGISTDSV
jgi:hypothetical protein